MNSVGWTVDIAVIASNGARINKILHQVFLLFVDSWKSQNFARYRSGTLYSNTVNSKFHLIRSFFEILATILSFHV